MTVSATVLAGRYRLHEQIAVGGVGEVWRAADVVLRRPVAVKLLRAGYAEHADTLERFRAEARHAASLSHPGIARVYDYGEGPPPCPPYLVMELVDGPSLAQVLARGPLGAARSMHVVAQAAAGLAAAHAKGLIHRDIKPANLLITPEGQVKITDFGIAHAAGSAPLTGTGMLIGTPAYLAPERVAGASGTPAADLYALGVVAYECLAGAPPFTGEPVMVAAAHRDRPLPGLPAGLPAGVAALVGDLTRKAPGERPRDAGEVARRAADLARSLTGEAAAGQAEWPPVPAPASGRGGARAPGQSTRWLPDGHPAGTGRWHPGGAGSSWHPGKTSRRHPGGAGSSRHPGETGRRHPGGTGRGYSYVSRRRGGRTMPGRPLPARAVVAAMTVVVVAAGLAGWSLAVASGAATGPMGPAGPAAAGRIRAGAAGAGGGPPSLPAARRSAGPVPAHHWTPANRGAAPDAGHRGAGSGDRKHGPRDGNRAAYGGRAWS